MHLEDKKVFSPELGFPAVSLDVTSKQTHKWHFVSCKARGDEVLWERSAAPLCGVSEVSAHISSVVACHSWVWVF